MVAPMTPQVEMQEGTELLTPQAQGSQDPPDGPAQDLPDDPGPGLVWLGARIPAQIKQKIVDTAETCKVSQQEVITRALGASLGGEHVIEKTYRIASPAEGVLTLEAPRVRLSIPPNACGVRITIEGPTSYGAVSPASPAEPAAELATAEPLPPTEAAA